MGIAKANMKLQRGDDEMRLIEFKQDDGSPYDLSNVARVDMHLATHSGTVLQLSTENGSIQIVDGNSGQLLLNFSHELTQNEKWISAEYDIQLTYQDGKIKTVLQGQITLLHDITKV